MNLKTRLSQLHWGLVLKASVLIYILTFMLGLGVSLLLLAFPKEASHSPFQAVFLITALLVMLVTGYGAWWVAHKVDHDAALHGFLVGLFVALISSILDFVFSKEINIMGLVLYVLMVAVGLFGGILGSRRREQ